MPNEGFKHSEKTKQKMSDVRQEYPDLTKESNFVSKGTIPLSVVDTKLIPVNSAAKNGTKK